MKASYINRSEVQVVTPGVGLVGLHHYVFANDYATFCGKQCDTWLVVDESIARTLESPTTCKRCVTAYLK